MQRAQDEDEPGEGGVGGDRLEPVVVDVEQDHLRLGGLEDQVSELLHLEACLEGQLELGALVGRGGKKRKKAERHETEESVSLCAECSFGDGTVSNTLIQVITKYSSHHPNARQVFRGRRGRSKLP